LQNPTNRDKIAEFLDTLTRRGPKAFEEFIRACVFTEQLNVARLLDEKLAEGYQKQFLEENAQQRAQNPYPPQSAPQPHPNQPNPSPQHKPQPYVPPQLNQRVNQGPMTEVPKEMGAFIYSTCCMHSRDLFSS
jgi:hypothetical protein